MQQGFHRFTKKVAILFFPILKSAGRCSVTETSIIRVYYGKIGCHFTASLSKEFKNFTYRHPHISEFSGVKSEPNSGRAAD